MYEILAAVDDNEERAMDMAKALSKYPGSDEIHVTILNVFEEFTVSDADGGSVDSDDIYELSELPDSVSQVRQYLEESGLSVDVRREHGDVETEILAVSEELNIDHIVVSGRKRSAVGKAVFGSVVQDVLLNADRPVTVVV